MTTQAAQLPVVDDDKRLKTVVHHKKAWYIVATSKELAKAAAKRKPLQVMLFGQPLVVYRTSNGVGALLDRCPHRGVPLSKGEVRNDRMTCGYHGWAFSPDGECVDIPCFQGKPQAKARQVPSFAAVEQEGYIWVYGAAGVAPDDEPFRFPFLDDKRYAVVRTDVVMEGSLQQVAENALDVPHTAYLHGGLFRKEGSKNEIDVVIRRTASQCEAQYIGEPAPRGLLGRLLAPGGGEVVHCDRFILPCITQVEYALGEKAHLVLNAALTPIDDFKTRLFGCVAYRLPLPLPKKMLGEALKPLAKVVLGQDADMLKLQTSTTQFFGEETMISTEVDCLGPHILRLLRAARDEEELPDVEKTFSMSV